MRKELIGVLVVAGAGLAALAGCATEKKPAPMIAAASSSQTGDGTLERSNTVTITATVEAIDLKKRLVTLRGPEGNSETIHVDDSVKNLPQVRKGDQVVATYYESVAVRVMKPGTAKPGITGAEGLERAKPGEKPAGVGTRTVTLTATITAIDRKKQTATLKGPKGKSVTVHVKDPTRLEGVKVGDLVEITYTEALAIAVEKASRK